MLLLPDPASPITNENGALNALGRRRQGIFHTKERQTFTKLLTGNESFVGTVSSGITSFLASLLYLRFHIR